ncbi:MAG: hypothetical protein PX634_09195, partial [Microcystis sp. M53600_WE12]|nr:hypothetical protein [Microcystis sp. M53600_WE12]
ILSSLIRVCGKKFVGGVRSLRVRSLRVRSLRVNIWPPVFGRGSQNNLALWEAEPFAIEERKCKGFEYLGSISQHLFLALFSEKVVKTFSSKASTDVQPTLITSEVSKRRWSLSGLKREGLQDDTDSHYKKSISQVWLVCQALLELFIGGIFTREVDKNNWQGAGAIRMIK